MSRETPPGRPPRWARSPGVLRSAGISFPFRSPAERADDGSREERPPFGQALQRLEIPIRITVLLAVAAPIIDALPLLAPPLWHEASWRLAVATSLAGGLMMPTVAALSLAFLALATRPRAPSPTSTFTVQALALTAILTVVAGLTVGVLVAGLVASADLAPGARGALWWDTARALLFTLANGTMVWAVARRRCRHQRSAADRPRPGGGLGALD